MKVKACSFAGHSEVYNENEIKLKLRNEIINLIENEKVTTFYNGGKGSFDRLCANCINELKKDYPYITSYLVLAYMPKEREKDNNSVLKLFDNTIYPNIERVPPRLAILKRNEWLVDNSDFLIAYVNHSCGGASKTLEYARKKKHIVINNIAYR